MKLGLSSLWASLVPARKAPPDPVVERPNYSAIARAELKPVLHGEALLQLLDLGHVVEHIREAMGLPDHDWHSCCLTAIHQFAEAVQLAPASEAHHHAYVGGLLVHTLDAILLALRLRRKHQLPTGAGAERVNEAAARWTYGVFCSLLLHDPGKVGANVQILAQTASGEIRWSPLNGSMVRHGVAHYRLAFGRADYALHRQIGLALFAELIPEAGRRWLADDQELLGQLLTAVYDAHSVGAGAIGEILIQADGLSAAKNLGQSLPAQNTGAARIPLVDKYMQTLRELLAEGCFKVNKPGAQLFVTRKRGDAEANSICWLLCRAAAEAVVERLRSRDTSVPSAIERVYDTLQECGMCELTRDGRAIHAVAVHSGEWRAEFTVLQFRAHRLFAPGKVPAPLAGSVKVRRATRANAQDDASVRTSEADARAQPANPAPTVDQQALIAALVGKRKSAPTTSKTEPVSKTQKSGAVSRSHSAVSSIQDAESVRTQETGATPAKETVTTPFNPRAIQGTQLVEAFFGWVNALLAEPEKHCNHSSAMIHGHVDGLLLVTPKVFRAFAGNEDWMMVQKAVQSSGYLAMHSRRHVHTYSIRDASGKTTASSLACVVVLPSACDVLLGALPPPNASIVGKV